MTELKFDVEKPLLLLIDNKSAINLVKNLVSYGRSKHIETRLHYLREEVNNGMLRVQHCPTEEQLADICTKPVKIDRYIMLKELLGVI